MIISTIHRQLNERLWLAFIAFVCVYSPTVVGSFIYKGEKGFLRKNIMKLIHCPLHCSGLYLPYQSWVFALEFLLQTSTLGSDLCLHRLRDRLGFLGLSGLGVSFALSFYSLLAQQNILQFELVLTSIYIVCKGAVFLSELLTFTVHHVVGLAGSCT